MQPYPGSLARVQLSSLTRDYQIQGHAGDKKN